ncbi:MAG: hypothetical protein R3F11_22940 [Verrucomicrobiales bacterium]
MWTPSSPGPDRRADANAFLQAEVAHLGGGIALIISGKAHRSRMPHGSIFG